MKAISPNQVVEFNQARIDDSLKTINDLLSSPNTVALARKKATEFNLTDGFALATKGDIKLDIEASMICDAFIAAGWPVARFERRITGGGSGTQYWILLSAVQVTEQAEEPQCQAAA